MAEVSYPSMPFPNDSGSMSKHYSVFILERKTALIQLFNPTHPKIHYLMNTVIRFLGKDNFFKF